jgi:hypothetical protein
MQLRSRTTKWAIAATCAAAATTCVVVPTAGAAAAPHGDRYRVAKVITSKVIGPLQFAIGRHIYVADSFQSALIDVHTGKILATGGNPKKGGDLAGVAVAPKHFVAYTASNGSHTYTRFVLLHNNKPVFKANLSALEKNRNPDHQITYGAVNPNKCQVNVLKAAHFPVHYRGRVDSHPYSVVYTGHHTWAVADAGGNDIIRVDTMHHRKSVLAVMPAQPFTIGKKFVAANHLPKCMLGLRYLTEAVPTDVERGANGMLYVSTLPGGPELPGMGPRGRIWTISPSGKLSLIGRGFRELTNIAVTRGGTVFGVELGKRISKLHNGKATPVMSLPGVAAIEWSRGHLYASTAPALSGAHKPGQILKLAHK